MYINPEITNRINDIVRDRINDINLVSVTFNNNYVSIIMDGIDIVKRWATWTRILIIKEEKDGRDQNLLVYKIR